MKIPNGEIYHLIGITPIKARVSLGWFGDVPEIEEYLREIDPQETKFPEVAIYDEREGNHE